MADPDTGVPVPILAVTIHPQTGLVYPLGGVHSCPLTRLPQPIQIGYPMLDSRTGDLVLTVGVSLDPVTGWCNCSVFSRTCSEVNIPSVSNFVCTTCRSCSASGGSSAGQVHHRTSEWADGESRRGQHTDGPTTASCWRIPSSSGQQGSIENN